MSTSRHCSHPVVEYQGYNIRMGWMSTYCIDAAVKALILRRYKSNQRLGVDVIELHQSFRNAYAPISLCHNILHLLSGHQMNHVFFNAATAFFTQNLEPRRKPAFHCCELTWVVERYDNVPTIAGSLHVCTDFLSFSSWLLKNMSDMDTRFEIVIECENVFAWCPAVVWHPFLGFTALHTLTWIKDFLCISRQWLQIANALSNQVWTVFDDTSRLCFQRQLIL